MRALLHSSTDTARHLLCDPAVLFHLIEDRYDDWHLKVAEEAKEHGALLLDTGSDGAVRVLVCVDEPADGELRAHALELHKGQLAAPSGRLIAGGPELLDTRGRPPETAEKFSLPKGYEASTMKLPAGVYDLEAFLLKMEFVEERAQQRQEEAEARIRAAFPRLVPLYWVRNLIKNLLAPITFFAVIFSAIFFLRGAFDRIVPWVEWIPAAWVVVVALGQLPPIRTMRRMNSEAAEAAAAEVPDLIVELKRSTALKAADGVVINAAST